ncbi:hypothetical protein FOA52_005010 [Chlamydomonas sp. UWO 241]|nr:hypothetical protein FOA52_005010 [Chlamydomonas sp. UWO 241]
MLEVIDGRPTSVRGGVMPTNKGDVTFHWFRLTCPGVVAQALKSHVLGPLISLDAAGAIPRQTVYVALVEGSRQDHTVVTNIAAGGALYPTGASPLSPPTATFTVARLIKSVQLHPRAVLEPRPPAGSPASPSFKSAAEGRSDRSCVQGTPDCTAESANSAPPPAGIDDTGATNAAAAAGPPAVVAAAAAGSPTVVAAGNAAADDTGATNAAGAAAAGSSAVIAAAAAGSPTVVAAGNAAADDTGATNAAGAAAAGSSAVIAAAAAGSPTVVAAGNAAAAAAFVADLSEFPKLPAGGPPPLPFPAPPPLPGPPGGYDAYWALASADDPAGGVAILVRSSLIRSGVIARLRFKVNAELTLSFRSWLQGRLLVAPTADPHALLAWWPVFKTDLHAKITELNAHLRLINAGGTGTRAAAEAALQAAISAAETESSNRSLNAVIDARRQFTAAWRAETANEANQRKIAWLQEERQVMDAVRLHAMPLPPELAVMAGSPTISTTSVKRVAKMTQPGKAPGPDGLPAELWSSFQPELAPMLASLYTAIGTTGQSPPGYLDGVIRCLPKPGDAADPANYRPITLLNTDYRLMGKVLAARLAPLLSHSIPPEQTAFLPGRLIGDNLAMLQLLPAWLRLCGEQHGLPATATLACLDFRKAYDTVSRPFLLAVMEAVGASPGLIGWAKTVLLDTRAAAMVNGFTSASYRSHAGVRQGCPLAPVLYLFIAWALNAWLCTCPVVGLVPAGWEGRRLLGDQYADDTHVLLRSRSPEDVQCFLRHMAVFARAFGQHLNEKKSVLVPVGSAHPIGEPVLIQGLKVYSTVTALGGPLWSGGPGGGSRPTNEAALLDDPTG